MDESVRRISLLDYLIVLAEKKLVFFVVMVLFCSLGVFLALRMPEQFKAKAVIMKSQTSSTSLASLLGKGDAVSGLLKSMDKMGGDNTDEILSILESRRLAQNVINKFNLIHYYGFDKSKRYYAEDVIKRVQKAMRVTKNKYDNIEVCVVDTNPVFAANMTNYILVQLDSIMSDLSKSSAQSSRIFYAERMSIIKNNLDSASKAFADFQEQNKYIDLDQQVKSTVEAMANLEAQKMTVELQLEQIKSQFGLSDQRVYEMQKKKDVIEKQIAHYMAVGGGSVLVSLNQAPAMATRYALLLRDVKIQEALYEFILQMVEQAKFTEANNTPQIQVLEYAQVPQKRMSPKRAMICMTFFMIGFVLASLGLLFWKWYTIQKTNKSDTYQRIRYFIALLVNKK